MADEGHNDWRLDNPYSLSNGELEFLEKGNTSFYGSRADFELWNRRRQKEQTSSSGGGDYSYETTRSEPIPWEELTLFTKAAFIGAMIGGIIYGGRQLVNGIINMPLNVGFDYFAATWIGAMIDGFTGGLATGLLGGIGGGIADLSIITAAIGVETLKNWKEGKDAFLEKNLSLSKSADHGFKMLGSIICVGGSVMATYLTGNYLLHETFLSEISNFFQNPSTYLYNPQTLLKFSFTRVLPFAGISAAAGILGGGVAALVGGLVGGGIGGGVGIVKKIGSYFTKEIQVQRQEELRDREAEKSQEEQKIEKPREQEEAERERRQKAESFQREHPFEALYQQTPKKWVAIKKDDDQIFIIRTPYVRQDDAHNIYIIRLPAVSARIELRAANYKIQFLDHLDPAVLERYEGVCFYRDDKSFIAGLPAEKMDQAYWNVCCKGDPQWEHAEKYGKGFKPLYADLADFHAGITVPEREIREAQERTAKEEHAQIAYEKEPVREEATQNDEFILEDITPSLSTSKNTQYEIREELEEEVLRSDPYAEALRGGAEKILTQSAEKKPDASKKWGVSGMFAHLTQTAEYNRRKLELAAKAEFRKMIGLKKDQER